MAGTPTRLMLSTWLMTLVIFYGLPIRYEHGPRLSTVLFLAACLGGFVYGSLVVQIARAIDPSRRPTISQTPVLEGPLRVFAVLGLVGAGLVGIDKIVLGGLDLSQGLGALRFVLQSEEEAF